MRGLWAVVVCVGLLLPSCTFRYGPDSLQDIGRYLALQPGISTTRDVHQRFGQPTDVTVNAEGQAWLYLHAMAQTHGATFVPYVGLVAGGNTVELTQATFSFDPEGRYLRVETTRNSRYQNVWVGAAESLQATADAEGRVRAAMSHHDMPFDEEAWGQSRRALKLRPVPPGTAPEEIRH